MSWQPVLPPARVIRQSSYLLLPGLVTYTLMQYNAARKPASHQALE